MHALVLRIPLFAGSLEAQSLAEELRSRGIPVIKGSVIATHKRQMQKESQSGIYTILGPVLSRINHFTNFAIFMAESPTAVYKALGFMSLVSIILSIVAPAVGLVAWPFTTFLVFEGATALFIVATIIVLTVVYMLMSDTQWRTLRRASSFWMRVPVWTFDEATLSTSLGIPKRLHDRARRAVLLKGAQVEIDVFTEDPLLCVSRPRFLFLTERAYIGGWDTGNPQIENV